MRQTTGTRKSPGEKIVKDILRNPAFVPFCQTECNYACSLIVLDFERCAKVIANNREHSLKLHRRSAFLSQIGIVRRCR